MSVSGIVVVIIIEMMQGLPATIIIFKVTVSSNIHHRWHSCKPLDGVCAMAAICRPLH